MATAPAPRSSRAHRPSTHRRTSGTLAAGRAPLARWERAGLLGVLAAAALLYGWGLNHAAVHPYYGAAIRSMATSWRAFLFGGLDPSGSITLDKVPGGFWPDAASVWLFGPHTWAVALPHVVEGALTVYVLHRTVRAWAGPTAALIAALALTATPVVAVLDRATIPDEALTLLLVLAAGALLRAAGSGRLRPLLACGMWVGLAFQAKMLQAWLPLPVFMAVYLLAAPGGALRRIGRVALLGATALAVSCSWLLLVLATRPSDRPYLDGTTNNNPFTLVFGYNGISRFGSDAGALGAVPGTSASRTTGNTGWGMLVNHTVGPQVAWLLPLALLAAVLGVLWRAGQPRGDLERAGFLLWSGWLLVHVAVFSTSNGNHAYYTVVIAPALAALGGGGLACFRREYRAPRATWRRAVLPAAIALTSGWALVLDAHTLFAAWLLPVVVMLALCSVAALWQRGPRTGPAYRAWALAAGVAAVLALPTAWAVSSVDPLYAGAATSPLAGPVGGTYAALSHHQASISRTGLSTPSARDKSLLAYLRDHRHGEKYLLATQAAYPAEPLLRAASEPLLVMGGFTGLTPFPTAAQLSTLVAGHQVRYAMLTTQRPTTQATTWVKTHCARVSPRAYGQRRADGSLTLYNCRPTAG
jgi:4-amino-4-deoxy-L-arabinose transferase-like glycosyltransferase